MSTDCVYKKCYATDYIVHLFSYPYHYLAHAMLYNYLVIDGVTMRYTPNKRPPPIARDAIENIPNEIEAEANEAYGAVTTAGSDSGILTTKNVAYTTTGNKGEEDYVYDYVHNEICNI